MRKRRIREIGMGKVAPQRERPRISRGIPEVTSGVEPLYEVLQTSA